MAKETVLRITRDNENDRIDMEIYVRPVELAAYLCAMMEKDVNFRKTLLIAVEVFTKDFKPPKPIEKPFAEA